MHGYETFDLSAKHIDQTYRIHVALPWSYDSDPSAKYPVIYVLDADFAFGAVYTAMTMLHLDALDPGVPRAIIVGVGYDDPGQSPILRTRDYSPENSRDDWYLDSFVEHFGRRAEDGGAGAFLSFIENELD